MEILLGPADGPIKVISVPIVKEAMLYDGTNAVTVDRWVRANGVGPLSIPDWRKPLVIPTLEGAICARPGDWIVRGVRGEFYPVKPEVFKLSYQEVKE